MEAVLHGLPPRQLAGSGPRGLSHDDLKVGVAAIPLTPAIAVARRRQKDCNLQHQNDGPDPDPGANAIAMVPPKGQPPRQHDHGIDRQEEQKEKNPAERGEGGGQEQDKADQDIPRQCPGEIKLRHERPGKGGSEKGSYRHIAAPLHRERFGLIGHDGLALHEQELTLLALGVRHRHRGAVVGPADHGDLAPGGLAAAAGPTGHLRRAGFMAARRRPHQIHPHPDIAIAGQGSKENTTRPASGNVA